MCLRASGPARPSARRGRRPGCWCHARPWVCRTAPYRACRPRRTWKYWASAGVSRRHVSGQPCTSSSRGPSPPVTACMRSWPVSMYRLENVSANPAARGAGDAQPGRRICSSRPGKSRPPTTGPAVFGGACYSRTHRGAERLARAMTGPCVRSAFAQLRPTPSRVPAQVITRLRRHPARARTGDSPGRERSRVAQP